MLPAFTRYASSYVPMPTLSQGAAFGTLALSCFSISLILFKSAAKSGSTLDEVAKKMVWLSEFAISNTIYQK